MAASSLSSAPVSSSGTQPTDTLQRRLSTRRGSRSAPDPWGQHAAENVGTAEGGGLSRSSSASRITILRVQDNAIPSAGQSIYDESSPGRHQYRRDSWGSNYSTSSNTPSGAPRNPSPGASRRSGTGRMSFALTSFTPIHPPDPEKCATHNNDGTGHPAAHRRSLSNSNIAMKPNLTAQQIYDLAMESTGHTQPNTPPSPAAGRTTRSRPTTPSASERATPAVFTPMPDGVLLPFVDRPAEVTQLLNELPTCRLFQLLKALFPESMHAMKEGEENQEDPTKWTFARLSQHLMESTRMECDDKSWVGLARTCIRTRSEALWERFKGALGVPAELEVEDEEDYEEEDVPVPSVPAGVLLPDVGANAPVSEDFVTPGRVGAGLAVAPTIDESGTALGVTVGPLDSRSVCEEELDEPQAVLEPVFADEDPESRQSPEIPFGPSSNGYFPSGASEGGYSNRYMENIGESEEEDEDNGKSKITTPISNPTAKVRDPGVPGSNVPTPVGKIPLAENEAAPFGTRRAHFGIPDSPEDTPSVRGGSPVSDKDYRDREIRALQITTTPAPNNTGTGHFSHTPIQHTSSPSFHPNSSLSVRAAGGAPDGVSTVSPAAPSLKPLDLDPASNDSVSLLSSSPAGASPTFSASNGAGIGGRRRPSETIGEALNNGRTLMSLGDPGGYQGFGGFGLTNPNKPYHPALSERGPGNPLFPSSFADLSVGPTLVANVPKTRSYTISQGMHYPSSLSHSRYEYPPGSGRDSPLALTPSTSPLRRLMSLGGGRRNVRGNWAEMSEYAVTVASASSDGGRA